MGLKRNKPTTSSKVKSPEGLKAKNALLETREANSRSKAKEPEPSSSDESDAVVSHSSDDVSSVDELLTSKKQSLFDDSDNGSDGEMERLIQKTAKSKASNSNSESSTSKPLNKYMKKAAGYTDNNSEWLTLKKDVKQQAKKIVKGGSDDEEQVSDESSNTDEDFDGAAMAEFDMSSDEDDDDRSKPAFELMEKQAARLEMKKKKMKRDAALELKEQEERAKMEIQESKEHLFDFPSDSILKKEKELGVDLTIIKQRFEDTLKILDDFDALSDGYHSRKDYRRLLVNDVAMYYGYNHFLIDKFLQIFSPAEALAFIQANESQRPLTIRVNTLKTRRADLTKALTTRGITMQHISWSKVGIQVMESTVPVGATPEYLAGHYMLQSASSMTAVASLDPQPDERVLDMCAAPGGKTTHIAQLMKNTGTLVANDIHPDRVKSLTANLHRLGVRNCIVTNCDGVEYPKVMGGFDRVLLDAPCTGTGVIARDVSVKVSKGQDDIVKLGHTQRRLILAAIDAIDANSPTGGILVYATCSITVEENEAIVDYALKKRFVKVIDSGMEVGKPGIVKWKHHRFNESIKLARRYYPHVFNMDGFFICKLKKIQNGVKATQEKKRKRSAKAQSNAIEEEDEFVEIGDGSENDVDSNASSDEMKMDVDSGSADDESGGVENGSEDESQNGLSEEEDLPPPPSKKQKTSEISSHNVLKSKPSLKFQSKASPKRKILKFVK